MVITSSYNDKVNAVKLTSLDIMESKYTTFSIDNLALSLNDESGYNDKFVIARTGKEFGGLYLDGKYVDLSIDFPADFSYRFKAKIKYPDLRMDESVLKSVVKIVTGTEIEYNAVKGTEKPGMPEVEINGYQMVVRISER